MYIMIWTITSMMYNVVCHDFVSNVLENTSGRVDNMSDASIDLLYLPNAAELHNLVM